jgi:hypothetical protein
MAQSVSSLMDTSLTRKKFLLSRGVAAIATLVGNRVSGPHKIPLVAHAEKGGADAVTVLEFLRPLVS